MERVGVDPINRLSDELIKDTSVTGRWIRFQHGEKILERVLIIERNGQSLSMFKVGTEGNIQEIPGERTIQRINRAYPCRVISFQPQGGGEPVILEDHEF